GGRTSTRTSPASTCGSRGACRAIPTRRARSARLPGRVDQVLGAGPELAVDGDLVEGQCAGQRVLLRVGAGKRRLDLGGDALPELLGGLAADLLQEGREQPAAHSPRLAEGARELG